MNKLYAFIISKKETLKRFLPMRFLRKCKWYLIQARTKRYRARPINKNVFNSRPRGINLIGDAQIECGLGQSLRLLASEIAESNLDFCIYDVQIDTSIRRDDHTWVSKFSKDAPFGINLLHINPTKFDVSYLKLGDDIFRNRYNIGFWLWELEEVPKENLAALKYVDEVWTPSEFVSNAFRKYTTKPVCTIPYHISIEADPAYDRQYFGLPEDKFLYLVMFDFNSSMTRKNPECAINAFCHAFSPDDQDVGLVIKVNNPTEECMDVLHTLLAGYDNVYYITDTLEKKAVNSLIACVDVYVSTHRAEGFGLVMAEAMLLKTACIATNWSSNTEFMSSDTACMVPYTLVQIGKGDRNYPAGATWADPDMQETARYMKLLKESPDYYREMVERAFDSVSEILGKDRVETLLTQRISQIYEALAKK